MPNPRLVTLIMVFRKKKGYCHYLPFFSSQFENKFLLERAIFYRRNFLYAFPHSIPLLLHLSRPWGKL